MTYKNIIYLRNTNKVFLLVLVLLLVMFINNFAQKYNPMANPRALVHKNEVRFTVLTPRVIRMEWSKDNHFEDHATLTFVNRNLPVPKFKVEESNGYLNIITTYLSLSYKLNSGRFTDKNLIIKFNMDGVEKVWKPGLKDSLNLLGTARTLDDYNGDRDRHTGKKLKLSPGIISRSGWAFIDDSKRPVFDNSKWQWVQPRKYLVNQDYYFFGYGYKFKRAMKDFVAIAGRIPIPPKFAFGYWWSRYWEYTDSEFRELINEFRIHDVPIDVLVVDMDWHITTKPFWYKCGKRLKDPSGQKYGWTGFTWNKNYFPYPKNFLDYTKYEGLKVALNLHPASGIQPHETVYSKMARAVGIDPTTKKYVPFNITNKKFAENFMSIVLRPLEKQGVDFWWIDWQQWGKTKIPGVNPTFYLNYVFTSDMYLHRKVRPLLFGRYGGLGNHRYQIGFSGDASISWTSLNYEPYFTTTAANVGYGYWSHDIGGHTKGIDTPEMYTRWIQFGAFSPILRTHATKNKNIERRIWAYPLKYFYPMRKAILLRYSLIPYIYTAAKYAFDTGISICHPMYYDHPKSKNAYKFSDEYMLGNDMIVNPVTHPMETNRLFTMQSTWLPKGKWIEWFSGKILNGGKIINRPFMINEIPVYVKAGAIIPMQPKMKNTHAKPVDPLILKIFPGESGKTNIYNDAGNNDDYWDGKFTFTKVKFNHPSKNSVEVIINPIKGKFPGMLTHRKYELRLPLTLPPIKVMVNSKRLKFNQYGKSNCWKYDGDKMQSIIITQEFNTNTKVNVELEFPNINSEYLSGIPGKLNRLKKFMVFLAGNPWDKSKLSNDIVVRAGQLGLRLNIDPQNAKSKVDNFYKNWKRILKMVADYSGKNNGYKYYLELLKEN